MNQPAFDYSQDEQDYSPSAEDALRDAMKKLWEHDLEVIKDRGEIPDWMGEPSPLSRDKARLLSLLYDVGYVSWTSGPSQNNRDVTSRMGLKNTGNAKAVIASCCDEGLVSSRLYRGSMIFEMTMQGEHALEDWQLEVEMGILQI